MDEVQSLWQLNGETMLEPTEADHDWVNGCIMFGSGYIDMMDEVNTQYAEHKIDETLYRRRLGAIFSYVMSLVYLDSPDREYTDEDAV